MTHNCLRAVEIACAATTSKGARAHNAVEEMLMIPYAALELVEIFAYQLFPLHW